MNKFLIFSSLLVFIISTSLFFNREVDISISQTLVNESINKKLPLLKKKYKTKLSINSLNAKLLENKTVHIIVDFNLKGYGLSAQGQSKLNTDIYYSEGKFTLHNITEEDIKLVFDKPEGHLNTSKEIAIHLIEKLKHNLTDNEQLYIKNTFENLKRKYTPVFYNFVYEIMEERLTSKPIYVLNENKYKEKFFKATLKNIKFENNEVIATLYSKPFINFYLLLFISFTSILGFCFFTFKEFKHD